MPVRVKAAWSLTALTAPASGGAEATITAGPAWRTGRFTVKGWPTTAEAVATGWPRQANYELNYAAVIVGVLVYGLSLWLFRRSHKDLGRQWSASLEIRESHQIVRAGGFAAERGRALQQRENAVLE